MYNRTRRQASGVRAKHILTGKKRRKSDEEKIFSGCQQQYCFSGIMEIEGAFLTWWSAAKEGEGKGKKEMV